MPASARNPIQDAQDDAGSNPVPNIVFNTTELDMDLADIWYYSSVITRHKLRLNKQDGAGQWQLKR